MAHYCILIEQFVEFAKLEENNLIIIVLFNSPVLLHDRCHSLKIICWDMQGGRIVSIAVFWTFKIFILNVLGFDEPRQESCKLCALIAYLLCSLCSRFIFWSSLCLF